ncbi:MAG: MFS transporter [Acidimicrobiia bacterium]
MKTDRRLAVGLFTLITISAFEATAVITALPTITDELGGDALYGATLAANLLANIVVIVAASDAADRLGPGRPFLVCASLFVVGLVVAGAATGMLVVVAGRILQGAGVGGFAAIAYVAVRRAIPPERQPVMYAWLSAGWVLPSLAAPALAGGVTDQFGWRWVFLGIIPLVVVAATVVAPPLLALAPSPDAAPRDRSRLVDAVRAAAGVAAVLGGLAHRSVFVVVPTVLAGGIVALPALRRLFPRGVIRARPGLPAIVACRLCATMAFLGVDSFLPLAADRIHGVGPIAQGMLIIGAAISWTGGQAFAARLHDKVPPNRLVRTGFAVLALGVVGASIVVDRDVALPITFAAWSVGGLGMGLLFNPTTVTAMGTAVPGEEGLVSSQMNMADSLGFALMGGLGGAVVAFADRTSVSLSSAILFNMGLALAMAMLGFVASRGVVATASAPLAHRH